MCRQSGAACLRNAGLPHAQSPTTIATFYMAQLSERGVDSGDKDAGRLRSRASLSLKRVRCAYVVEQMPTGVSGAWKVVGDDGETYVIKFNMPRDHTALNELVCACIAEQFGLPSFEPVLVDVDIRQAAHINTGRAAPVAAGTHFAVRLVAQLYSAGSLEATMGRRVGRGDLSNADRIPDVLGFDTLVQNHDRHCGNVCFIFDAVANSYSFCIFDHGHAFGGPSWSPEGVEDMYRNLAPISQFCLPLERIDGSRDFEGFMHMVESSLAPTLGSLAGEGGVPGEWCTNGGGIAHLKHAIESLDPESLRSAVIGYLRSGGGS